MVLWGCPPPRGQLSVSSVPPEEHGIEGPVPRPPGGPLVGPAQPPVLLPHQGKGLLPQRVRDRAPVPLPWPALLRPPCRPPSLPLRLRRRCRAPSPLRRGHPRRLRPRRGGGVMVLVSQGLGGDELAGIRVHVVEVVVVVVVVVVGMVCRHLLDAEGDAPHRLHVRLRGCPALCPPPFAPSSPLGSNAPSRLSLGARRALALALGPLSSPLPLSWVPPPVPHALARSLSHLLSPCPLHLSSLPAPLRALPVPWPLPGPLLPPAAAPFLDHSPGVPLPLQLRQRDARRRALARRGADVPLPPRGEGLWGGTAWGGWCGCGWGWRGRGTSRSPCPLPLLRRPPARRPRPVRGSSPACAACWGPRRGWPRRCRGPPGSRPQPLARPPRSPSLPWRPPTRRPWPLLQPLARPPRSPLLPRRPPVGRPRPVRGPPPAFAARWRSRPQPLARPPRSPSLPRRPLTRRPWPVRLQPLARPSCSPLRLRRPSAMRPVPAPGPPPVSAACRGPRSGPRRGSPRSPLPALQGGAGRRGWLLGRQGRPSRPAQAPGPAAAARPAPPPPPASAPCAPRGSPPSTPGRRRGSGSGTGCGGGRPAGGTHRSLPSLLPW